MAPQETCGLYEIASVEPDEQASGSAFCAPITGRGKAGLSSNAIGLSIAAQLLQAWKRLWRVDGPQAFIQSFGAS